jgi:hypothetical protein
MSRFIFTVSIAVLLFSCHKETKQEAEDSERSAAHDDSDKFARGVKTINASLGESLSTAPANLNKNLYGKFFYDRAEYYIIENPSNKLWGRNVLKSTLYYFDGQLYKIKYLMADDISHELINEHRQFKVRPLDSLSRVVVKSQAVVFQQNSTLMMNDNLSAYELTWTRDDKLVKWRTSLEHEGKYFEYSEILASYKKKYKELELFESQY